jgi:hypothetical protein
MTSEIVSQVLFGEDFEILEKTKQWSRIKMHFDGMKLDRFKTISSYIRIKFQLAF